MIPGSNTEMHTGGHEHEAQCARQNLRLFGWFPSNIRLTCGN